MVLRTWRELSKLPIGRKVDEGDIMRKLLVTLVASAATFTLAGVASAEEPNVTGPNEPILLTAAQMAGVTAGRAFVSADLTGDAIVDGSFHLDNLPGEFSVAEISATIFPFNPATLVLTARADTFD
jgi:hypothetical protein